MLSGATSWPLRWLAIYRERTGRINPPTSPATEAWLMCGRRAGKSFILALIAVYLACFKDFRPYLQPGERATILILATDRKQARTIFRYIRGLLTGIPMLAAMIERETSDAFDLKNSITIEVATASYKVTRGYTLAACLADEIAFWGQEESAEPDYAVLDAVRPGMATLPGSMLLCASTAYAKKGALHDASRRHYGKDGDPTIFWKATTRQMNSTVRQSIIDAAMERDPQAAASEWMAEWRNDIAAYVPREVVEAAVSNGCFEIAPATNTRYVAFVDPSGGSSDSFTLAIAHRSGDKGILDCVREVRPPFSPDAVVEELAALMKTYGIKRVTGDKYAGEFPRELFRKQGITYDLSERTKSQIYIEALPLLNSGRVELLDNQRLISQLCGLERRTARGGKDSIDHPQGSKDDVANASAGVLVLVASKASKAQSFANWAHVNIAAI